MNIEVTKIDVPDEIIEASKQIQLWAIRQGVKHWQVGYACSRSYALAIQDHAPHLRTLKDHPNATVKQAHNVAVKKLKEFVIITPEKN